MDGSDVTGFGSFDNSTCKRVLDLLESGYLTLGQVVIKRVAVVKLGVNNGSGNGGSCFGTQVWTDTAKLTNIVIARFGDRWDLVRKSEVFVKEKIEWHAIWEVRQKRSSVDVVEPLERVKCWRREWCWALESLVNTRKWSRGDQWVKETAGASEVLSDLMTKS